MESSGKPPLVRCTCIWSCLSMYAPAGSKAFHSLNMGRVAVAAAVSWWLIRISILVNRIFPDPYMDEIFHVPQAQKYCRGNFRSWDPMITTPPGLIAHPYRLADNRHYPFYLWQKVINYHWSTKYLMVPLYVYSMFSILNNLAKDQKKIWLLVYILACAGTLIPTPLIEFRYYTVPFYFLILHTHLYR